MMSLAPSHYTIQMHSELLIQVDGRTFIHLYILIAWCVKGI